MHLLTSDRLLRIMTRQIIAPTHLLILRLKNIYAIWMCKPDRACMSKFINEKEVIK